MKNRNKWVMKAIGKQWCDKDYMMIQFFSALIIHFVEEEKAFEVTWWGDMDDIDYEPCAQELEYFNKVGPELKKKKKIIEKAYKYFKKERPKLEREMDASWIYSDKGDKMESELFEKDTEILKSIIEIRGTLWT
jgi:hypothetical protein